MKKYLLLISMSLFLVACNKNNNEASIKEISSKEENSVNEIISDIKEEVYNDEFKYSYDNELDYSYDTEENEALHFNNNILIDKDSETIVIKEKMFLSQTMDMYYNPEDYIGKTIKYEGIFDEYYYEEVDKTCYYVIRYGPGCCGNDSNVGFEIRWNGGLPKQNDWVELEGTLNRHNEGGFETLIIDATSLKNLDRRGIETVLQ